MKNKIEKTNAVLVFVSVVILFVGIYSNYISNVHEDELYCSSEVHGPNGGAFSIRLILDKKNNGQLSFVGYIPDEGRGKRVDRTLMFNYKIDKSYVYYNGVKSVRHISDELDDNYFNYLFVDTNNLPGRFYMTRHKNLYTVRNNFGNVLLASCSIN